MCVREKERDSKQVELLRLSMDTYECTNVSHFVSFNSIEETDPTSSITEPGVKKVFQHYKEVRMKHTDRIPVHWQLS